MLMLEGYVPPQSLGALFQAMARVPGATVLPGEVRDAAGRRAWPCGRRASSGHTST
ncbi:hypothetical protein NKG94_39760 [Micromonospora sp. M12]